jgi:hypothetical protein
MKLTKTKTIRALSLALAFTGTVAFTSCKGEGAEGGRYDTISETGNTEPEEGMSSRPMGDTLVEKDGDTIVKTGTGHDTKENPVGDQVP